MWLAALGVLKALIGPVFNFLNARVDADKQIQITSIGAQESVGNTTLNTIANADNANARLREKGEKWSSPAIVFMALVLAPLVWHEWQVVLDSSRWIPVFSLSWPWFSIIEHAPGTWRIAALPGVWEATEQAIFQSLFIGASAAVAGVAVVKALRR